MSNSTPSGPSASSRRDNPVDDIQKALNAYAQAAGKLGKLNGKAGPGSEAIYSAAYQRLVQLGVAPQIRRKYR